jgi:S-adenosylmethionine:tRNA ribosyltransferase-isomerase
LLEEVGEDHQLIKVDLSVGLGTFSSIDEDNFKEEKLHTEEYFVSEEAAKEIEEAKHITAVGTTSVRTLESATNESGGVKSGAGSTDIFITPDYKFKRVNSLITNFHLPGTSLLYLVAAFLKSEDELIRIYEHAIENGYRFFSFGDAMLIL